MISTPHETLYEAVSIKSRWSQAGLLTLDSSLTIINFLSSKESNEFITNKIGWIAALADLAVVCVCPCMNTNH